MALQPLLGYYDQGHDLTGRAFYDSALKPFGLGTTLPPLAYRSKAFAELEDEKIWTRAWVCMGHQDRIPDVGDILPFTIGSHGVHLRRRADLGLEGHFNFAQHGGCRFVPRQCQTGRKTTCSFTSCGHSRDRDVMHAEPGGVETPEMYMYLGNNPDKLIPVQIAALGTLAFANLDVDRQDLGDQLGSLASPLRHYLASGINRVGRFQRVGDFNWKLFPRSVLEPVSATTMPPSDTAASHAASAPPTEAFWGISFDAADEQTRPLELHDARLPALDRGPGSHVIWIYPNLLLQLHDRWMSTVIVQPIGLTETLLQVDVFQRDHGAGAEATGVPDETMSAAVAAIDLWSGRAARAQRDIAGNDNPSPFLSQRIDDQPATFETCEMALDLQRFVVERLLARHEYVSRPLYTNPGRSLNASVNAGAG